MKTSQHIKETLKFNKAINKIAPVIAELVREAVEDNKLCNRKSFNSKTIKAIEEKIEELKAEHNLDRYFSIWLVKPEYISGGHLQLTFKTSYNSNPDSHGCCIATYLENSINLAYIRKSLDTRDYGNITNVEAYEFTPENEVTVKQYNKDFLLNSRKLNINIINLRNEIEEINKTLPKELKYVIQTYIT